MLGIIIQARMGSNRLPGKILKPIGDKLLLEHILFRLTKLENDAVIIIATSTESIDDEVEQFCRKMSVRCFRGSEQNVLERYYLCAKQLGFDEIIRLTADNPFVDVEEIDNLIGLFRKEKADYAKSFGNLPCGIGAEIFTFEALEKDYNESSMPHHFEHVNEYILENPDKFKTVILTTPDFKNRPDIRLTVDTQDDYQKACYIVENCNEEYVCTETAIKLALDFESFF